MVHTAHCGYGHLLRRVEQLESQLIEKDKEIERLRKESEARSSGSNVHHIFDSISRGLEKLDADSARLFEDAKGTLRKTRTNFKNSAAFQTSLQVLHSIREVVESARHEFVAKMMEFELVAKNKVRLIAHNANAKPQTEVQICNVPNPDGASDSIEAAIPVDTSIIEQTQNSIVDNNNNNNIAETSNPQSNIQEVSGANLSDDEDLKEFLIVSRQEYLLEQEARNAEEEAVRQAMRLSLLDIAKAK
jgi:hypothetical protein